MAQYAVTRARKTPFRRKMLLLSAANQRSDGFIEAMGAATAGFDQVFCAEHTGELFHRSTDDAPMLARSMPFNRNR